MSALDDVIVMIEWLSITKTMPGHIAQAMKRLKEEALTYNDPAPFGTALNLQTSNLKGIENVSSEKADGK